MTLSYGVAVMVPESGRAWGALVKMADELLIEAKNSGRNQIKASMKLPGEDLAKSQSGS